MHRSSEHREREGEAPPALPVEGATRAPVDSPDCIFCRIVKGEIPCQKVWESAQVLAFCDIHPKAPVHIVIIPKTHIATMNDLRGNAAIAAALLDAAATIAHEAGVAESGYRLIANTNQHGGQEVFHVHFHLLGGRPLGVMIQE